MRVRVDTSSFIKDLNNVIGYSNGFLEGAKIGKSEMLKNIANTSIEALKEYIDTSAKLNPAMLHHVYEWYQTGSPAARLYNIEYTISNVGLSFGATFRQSVSVKNGSSVPFYNKAKIMELGIPVTIKPKNAKALRFEDEAGEEVFTKNPVRVQNPGGTMVQGGFQRAFDAFFNLYFSQAFIRSSGLSQYLKNPVAYKKNLPAGRKFGRSVGIQTGYRWIAGAGVDI